MKKLLSVVLASLALVSMAQARFYVGVEGGYSAESFYGTGLRKNSVNFSTAPTDTIEHGLEHGASGFSIGGVFGSEDFYGKYFGTRWGLGAGYTNLSKNSFDAEYVDVGFSFDLILNFINTGRFSFGVFGGVSADYHYLLIGNASSADHLFDFNGRVGVSTLMANHHRIDVFAKLPVASMNIADGSKTVLGGGRVPARTTFGASYKFVF